MYFAHHSYLGVMGFVHVTPSRGMTNFMSFDWRWYVGQWTYRSQVMDFALGLTVSYKLRDRKYESCRVRVEGRTST